ncbi:hypothetical protein EDB19DRAFT_1900678 [Suillus lakei]|nr:hypothetical protein EDB19DRAFT_1900678 [Suillus lakei]
MHICLLPAEILLHIFAIYKNHNIVYRATLAALARICRTFKEPALDILWEDVDGFKPLISCLLEGVITKERRKLTMQRPLFDEEWRLTDRYTRRIRSFSPVYPELDMIGDWFLQALISTLLPTPLLPDLRRLNWCDS